MKKILALVPCVLLLGCSQSSFNSSSSGSGSSVQKSQSIVPVCLTSPPDYQIEVIVESYEVTDSGGFNFGFDLLTNFLKALNLQLSWQSGQVTMDMNIYQPMDDTDAVASGTGTADSANIDFTGSVDISEFNVGANYYYTTPFAKLTANGLSSAFSVTSAQLAANTKGVPWSTSVTLVDAGSVVLPVGSMAGLQVGDQFNIYQTDQEWLGEPCHSTYIPVKNPVQPIAVGVVSQLLPNATVLQLSNQLDGYTVAVGDLVEVAQLVPAAKHQPARQLLHSASIRPINSAQIPIQGGGTIDIGSYAQDQIKSLLHNYGFYEREQTGD